MPSEIIASIISLVGTLVGTLAGILTSTKLTIYRIKQLEKKVEKHNSIVERTALPEHDMSTVWHEINVIREQVVK